jgi:uncharacterized protein YneF (UPF0154 family)
LPISFLMTALVIYTFVAVGGIILGYYVSVRD